MRHVLAVIAENKPGVLTRVTSLFSRRCFNIDSLTVGKTENPRISRVTIVVTGDDTVLEQVTKQLNKLIDILKVQDVSSEDYVDRELILIKVNTPNQHVRNEVIQISNIFRVRIVDMGKKTLTLEATGAEGKINALEAALKPFGIKELVRTGKIAMLRGTNVVAPNSKEEE